MPKSATEDPAGERPPRLPHERDESSDSAGDETRDVIRQAHDDVASGRKDTDRSAVTNQVYKETLRDRPSRG